MRSVPEALFLEAIGLANAGARIDDAMAQLLRSTSDRSAIEEALLLADAAAPDLDGVAKAKLFLEATLAEMSR